MDPHLSEWFDMNAIQISRSSQNPLNRTRIKRKSQLRDDFPLFCNDDVNHMLQSYFQNNLSTNSSWFDSKFFLI